MCAGTTRTPASAKGSKVGDLMVEGTYIFDCEVFAYDWLFDFKDVVTGEHISIWNDNDAVIAFMERDPFLGGFNNKHYDNFILKAVMCGFTPEEVKKVNDLIIQEELSGWDIPSLKEYRVFFDSFDLRDDCQDGISLKAIEAHLGIPIEETGVDFNIDRPLTESERRRTEYYCRYDVDATEILWKLRQGYLDNKVAVGAKRGLTDRSPWYERGGMHPADEDDKPTGGRIFVRPDYPEIPDGGRNISLTSLAGALHNTGYTPMQIYQELQRVNKEVCKPPLPDRELQIIAESISRYRR